MYDTFKNFYQKCYLNTNGFIPSSPLNQNIFPGDFFQIRNGAIIVLGNIFRAGIVDIDHVVLDRDIRINPSNWDFSHGVSKPFSGRDVGHNDIDGDFEFSKQIIEFEDSGSFLFKGNNPQSIRISNWNSFQNELIIKLTQVQFSFREVYVVTESVSTSEWTLAISESNKGELEIAMNGESGGLDIFGHEDSRTIQAKDLSYYNQKSNRKPTFFKAKRLAIQNDRVQTFISDLINDKTYINDWAREFFKDSYKLEDATYVPPLSKNAEVCVLDMLPANQLNPNTALQYFKWEDTNLDDIEKLFTHGQ